MNNIIFGPVPSRRFGKSLGIDLFPQKKTCNFNCIYCEAGEGVPVNLLDDCISVNDVINPLFEYLNENKNNLPDCITFAGSGEPVLHPDIDKIIKGIKEMTTVPVVLLTNGSLFFESEFRKKVMDVDFLVPSLDAGIKETYLKINRPNRVFSFENLVKGLIEMKNEFKGKYILEILLVGGINTFINEFQALKKLVDKINPDYIQINSVFRPPAVDGVRAATEEEREQLTKILGKKAEMVVLYRQKKTISELKGKLLGSAIINTVKIRPCTVSELADSLSANENEMKNSVSTLIEKNILKERHFNGEIYLEKV